MALSLLTVKSLRQRMKSQTLKLSEVLTVEHAKVGHKEKAFEYLEQLYQRRELWMSLLKVEPGLDSLRDDPRFDELVKRVGLK